MLSTALAPDAQLEGRDVDTLLASATRWRKVGSA
jgi:hypothetical protein